MGVRKTGILRWSKSEVASMLGITYEELTNHITDDLKKKVNWKSGRQYFLDVQVFEIIKYFRGLLTDQEIKQLIYPKGY